MLVICIVLCCDVYLFFEWVGVTVLSELFPNPFDFVPTPHGKFRAFTCASLGV